MKISEVVYETLPSSGRPQETPIFFQSNKKNQVTSRNILLAKKANDETLASTSQMLVDDSSTRQIPSTSKEPNHLNQVHYCISKDELGLDESDFNMFKKLPMIILD